MVTNRRKAVPRWLLGLLLLFLAGEVVEAGTHVWTGANSALWSDNGNWTGGTPAGDPEADLIFPAGARLNSTNDIAGVTFIDSITFEAGGYTLDGNPISLTNSIRWEQGPGTNTIQMAMDPGSVNLNFGMVNRVLHLAGPISGGPMGISAVGGPSTVILSGANTHTETTVNSLAFNLQLVVNGAQPTSSVRMFNGTLSGTGTFGNLDTHDVSYIRPGSMVPGVLNVAGNVFLTDDGTLAVRLNGPNQGVDYDHLNVTGTTTLFTQIGGDGARLDLDVGYTAPVGQAFTILQSAGGLTGTFVQTPDGTIRTAGCQNFRVNYTPNSVVLTRVAGGGPPLSSVQLQVTGSTVVCTNSTGGTATVTDTGGCSNTHQWGFRAVSGGAITDIPSQTGTSYVINGADFPSPGTYYLVVTTTPQVGSPMTSNEAQITVIPPPTAVATGSGKICLGSSTALHGSGAAMCSWAPATGLSDPNSCDPVASPSVTMTYSLTVSGATGCTSTNSAQVTVTVDPACAGPWQFHTLAPCRLADTRLSGGPIATATERLFAVWNVCGVPSTAKAVALNLTATEGTSEGFLVVYRAGSLVPPTSTVNFRASQTRANNVVSQIGPAGDVAVYCGGMPGSVHAVLDVVGYFD